MSSLIQRLAAIAAGVAVVAVATTTLGAQARPSFGVFGGAVFPTGDFRDGFDTGYDVGAFVGFKPAASPVGLRIDGMYNRFEPKSNLLNVDAHLNVLAGTANLVIAGSSPAGMVRPYFIGGLGIYNIKGVVDGESNGSDTKAGINGGAGLDVGLSGISVFIEARYHYVFTKDTNAGTTSNLGFVPVVVGLRF